MNYLFDVFFKHDFTREYTSVGSHNITCSDTFYTEKIYKMCMFPNNVRDCLGGNGWICLVWINKEIPREMTSHAEIGSDRADT